MRKIYGFLTCLDVRVYKSGEFVLLKPLIFSSLGAGIIEIPKGFITDFASVPKIVQLLPGFDVNGESRPAAVVHDYLYCVQSVDRNAADHILWEALADLGLNRILARMFWLGVRVGGWMYWNKRNSPEDNIKDFVPESFWSEERVY